MRCALNDIKFQINFNGLCGVVLCACMDDVDDDDCARCMDGNEGGKVMPSVCFEEI